MAINSTGSISSAGIGSGLDVDSIVQALVAVESRPITQLETQSEALQSKVSTFGTVQSHLSAFRDAAGTLSRPAIWNQTTGSSSDATAVQISTGSETPPGNYSVEVTKLATSQSLASVSYAATTSTVGAGTLSIQLGTWGVDQGSFTGKSGTSAVNVTVSATDSLADVRDKINAAGAGVTASILNDGSGSRLVIRSRETGAEDGFRITAVDADGNNGDTAGLSRLAYDPSVGVAAMQQTQAAGDAAAKINGLDVTSKTNTLTDVLDGMTITLSKVTAVGSPVMLTAAQDKEAIKTAVKTFVESYNTLQSYLGEQTRYDAESRTAGALQGDSTANTIRNQLRQLVGSNSGASAMFTRLSDIGMDIQRDGTIKLSDSKLNNALANTGELKKMFSNVDNANEANNGLATTLRSITDGMLNSTGALKTRTSGLQEQIQRNGKRQDVLQDRVDAYEKRVRAQYSALDTQMASMSSLSAYLTQQLSMLNKQASS